MPIAFADRMTRQAISPRLAMSSFRIIGNRLAEALREG
jgi:hypothetical protein